MFGDVEKRKQQFETSVRSYEREWSQIGDKLHIQKWNTLKELQDTPIVADEPWAVGMDDWKYAILNKKVEQLVEAKTVEDVKEVMLLPKHHRNTVELPTQSKYWLLEEECLFWSIESSNNPLSLDGYKRYMKCFDALCKERGIMNPLAENPYVQMTATS
jgi:hypothetical protein